jgi:hypothetical protein
MKEELKKELGELSPLLKNLREKANKDSVPNHFFNNMQIDIMHQIRQEIPLQKNNVGQGKSFWHKVQTFGNQFFTIKNLELPLASFVILIAVGIYFSAMPAQPIAATNCVSLDCVPQAELEQYILENIEDFEEEELFALHSTLPTDDKSNLQNTTDTDLDLLLQDMIENGEILNNEL